MSSGGHRLKRDMLESELKSLELKKERLAKLLDTEQKARKEADEMTEYANRQHEKGGVKVTEAEAALAECCAARAVLEKALSTLREELKQETQVRTSAEKGSRVLEALLAEERERRRVAEERTADIEATLATGVAEVAQRKHLLDDQIDQTVAAQGHADSLLAEAQSMYQKSQLLVAAQSRRMEMYQRQLADAEARAEARGNRWKNRSPQISPVRKRNTVFLSTAILPKTNAFACGAAAREGLRHGGAAEHAVGGRSAAGAPAGAPAASAGAGADSGSRGCEAERRWTAWEVAGKQTARAVAEAAEAGGGGGGGQIEPAGGAGGGGVGGGGVGGGGVSGGGAGGGAGTPHTFGGGRGGRGGGGG